MSESANGVSPSLPAAPPVEDRSNLISKKKQVYPITDFFRSYLERYGRIINMGIRYEDLLRYDNQIALYDEHGRDTLWVTVFYPPHEQREIHEALCTTYAILRADGDLSITDELVVDRVDMCLYGNTLPFRIRIVNRLNENFDYFYVKRVDANRVYGLELEHILSPNRINYFINGATINEEHIIGIPANVFMEESMPDNRFDEVRLAKEFVKFNERCFIRLLGDMHSGNFVIDIQRDFEKWHYRFRPIDFDQQSHHWRMQVYLPQLYRQNLPLMLLSLNCLAPQNVLQYQKEERGLIAQRVRVSAGRFQELMTVMSEDVISSDENVRQLREQLAEHYGADEFHKCLTMGDLVMKSIQVTVSRSHPATPWLKDGTVALL